MPELTVSLGAGPTARSAEVGGKAEGLSELLNRGFDVPRGFCVTAEAFRRVLGSLQYGAESLEELRAELEEVELEDSLRREISDRMRRIGADRWAVRSSSLVEDRPASSFAGQERTELSVRGLEGVLEAVRRVWADFFAIEGILYRTRIRVDSTPGAMAVVVQEMVEAECGGVSFTRDPVGEDGERATGSEDGEVLIGASASDPRGVVDGRTGVHYRIERQTGRVLDVPADGPLDSEQVDEIVRRSLEVERALGAPRDIEWVWGVASSDADRRSRLYLLQARPLTGRDAGPDRESVWTNANVGEALPGVATPFTWSIIGDFSQRGFERAFGTLGLEVPEGAELVGSFRGRVYLNLTEFVSIASGIPILRPGVLFEMAGGGGVDLVREVARERSPVEFLCNLPRTVPKIVASQLAMPVVSQFWSDYFGDRLEEFFELEREDWTRGALAAELREIDRLFDRTGRIMLACSSNFLMSYVVMRKFLEWFGRPGALDRRRQLFEALEVRSAEPVLGVLELTRRLEHRPAIARLVSSTEPSEVLEELERRAAGGGEDAREFLEAFESFRDDHGHRAPREAELSTPRWREESGFIFEMLREYLETDELPDVERVRREWEQKPEELDELVGELFGAVAGRLFRGILDWARATARIREFMRARVVESLDMYRAFARECGRRLVEMGLVREVDDVFYLRREEIRARLDGGSDGDLDPATYPLRVLVRRAVVEKLRELPEPPNTFVAVEGEMVDVDEYRRRHRTTTSRDQNSGRILRGLAGSGGRASGPARVVRDPEEDGPVRSGEILVAPHTDVGWTPMFMTASAVVAELGGPLSHACIVAREFGIPTVVNAQGAVEAIETGDRLTVDGDEGIVMVHGRDVDGESPQHFGEYPPEESSRESSES